jgi:hypothetical protein
MSLNHFVQLFREALWREPRTSDGSAWRREEGRALCIELDIHIIVLFSIAN